MTYTLTPDQTALIHEAREKVRGGCKALLIQGATGSGKTVVASEIISGAYRKGKVCFFIVPRRDLLRQTSETLKQFGIYHSFIAAGMRCDTKAKIFVCSTATLKNKLAIVPDIAIVDETHYGGAMLDRIIKRYRAAGVVVIGLSATPERLDGRGLGCWYEDMICGPSIKWLIANKRLSQYRAFAPDTPDLSNIRVVAGDYNKKQLSERMTDDRVLIGSSVKHYQKHAMGKLGVTFGVSIKHSEMLAQAYRDAGIPAMHMDGETPEDERVKISRAFAMRELLQLCCAELLCFGYDLSTASGVKNVCIQSMTDCQPSMSYAKQGQKNGRNLRYDSEPHTFFDHAGNISRHGLPDDDRVFTLADREKTGRGGGERSVPVRQCTQCYFCHTPAPVCPNCSYIYPIQAREVEQIEGELAEIQAQQVRVAARKEQGKARSLEELIAIGKERGYKNPAFWAKKVLGGRA